MPAEPVEFESADRSTESRSVNPDPQTAVTPGDRPGTARVTTRDGEVINVVGDYREVHADIQAAAAVAHEEGDDRSSGGEAGDHATVRELADQVLAGRPTWADRNARAGIVATGSIGPEGRAAVRRVLASHHAARSSDETLATDVEKRIVGLIRGIADNQPAAGAD